MLPKAWPQGEDSGGRNSAKQNKMEFKSNSVFTFDWHGVIKNIFSPLQIETTVQQIIPNPSISETRGHV